MAKINLRPWREERTAARQKDFVTNLVASAICAAALVLMMGYYYDVQMDRQNARNDFMKANISKLDERIKEIEELKRQRERLLERLNAIQELQGNRPIIVRNFDELVRVLPDGLHYDFLERKEAGFSGALNKDAINIKGLALQNKDVSELMRRLNSSIWFGEPNLSQVGALGAGAGAARKSLALADIRAFDLSVILTKPKAEDAK
ncbi:PilN domain-containing protein [Neptunomonas japonica]|uniref:Type IV pilus assembly protein PilN n=1 Tax=Neptunomonas japonica JAMM 1380 TaxID=1441457 RepID=A0A7R6PEY9_9GAMM|nr:PilN domain-containing protein [Neptunomonas japonica]BBB28313.1 type IV pilus assembly protein PilN [Neptunomonas japonica JAMM 1380]